MKNSLGRNVIDGYVPYVSSHEYKNNKRVLAQQKSINNKIVYLDSISKVFDELNIQDNMTVSFHHHLRNGDYVMNMVSEEVLKRNIKNLHYAPSSIFPNNAILSTLIENENIVDIDTNYLNGPVAKTINKGKLTAIF